MFLAVLVGAFIGAAIGDSWNHSALFGRTADLVMLSVSLVAVVALALSTMFVRR